MPNVLTHKARELKAETRIALEAELGRSLQDDEEVSIMVFGPHDAPTGKARAEAGNRLRAYLQRMDEKSQAAATEQTEEALNEALRHARPGYRERDGELFLIPTSWRAPTKRRRVRPAARCCWWPWAPMT
jgi:hypothetical protein